MMGSIPSGVTMDKKTKLQIWIESRINDFAFGWKTDGIGRSSRVTADDILEMVEDVLFNDASVPDSKPWEHFAIK